MLSRQGLKGRAPASLLIGWNGNRTSNSFLIKFLGTRSIMNVLTSDGESDRSSCVSSLSVPQDGCSQGRSKCCGSSQTSSATSSVEKQSAESDLDEILRNGRVGKRNRVIALDCEMVGVGERKQSALARCSIVDYYGNVLFDKYVRPKKKITDYRTRYSGIKPIHMKTAVSFTSAQKKVKKLLKNKIVVGHAIHMDLKVLCLRVKSKLIRDTSRFSSLRILSGLPLQTTPSLKNLSSILLGRAIQSKSHCSVEDARATLDLYKYVEEEWEENLDIQLNSKKYLNDKFWPPWIAP